jgi:hypothetical protein
MVASRPTVMAPPRSHAPPRAFIAHFNAQKMANARLKDASGSRLTLRSKTAQARRSLTATQELRDTFATIDVEGTPGIRSSPARARTARTRPGRATDGSVARRIGPTHPPKNRVSVRKEPFRGFRHSTRFPRRFRRFAKRETAPRGGKRSEAGSEKSLFLFLEKKRNLPSSWFWFFCAKRTDARSSFRCFFQDKQTRGRFFFLAKKRLR